MAPRALGVRPGGCINTVVVAEGILLLMFGAVVSLFDGVGYLAAGLAENNQGSSGSGLLLAGGPILLGVSIVFLVKLVRSANRPVDLALASLAYQAFVLVWFGVVWREGVFIAVIVGITVLLGVFPRNQSDPPPEPTSAPLPPGV